MKSRKPSIPPPRRPPAPAQKAPGAVASAVAAKLATAMDLHQKGELTHAEALYREILQSQPRHFDALQLLATASAQQNKAAEAVVLFEQALQVHPNHASSLNNYGVALEVLQRPQDALVIYDRAVKLEPGYAEAWNNRGNALLALKHYEEALISFERALAIRPGYIEALSNRGNALRGLKHPDQALESYDQALKSHPGHAEVLNNRGNALRDLKRPKDALDSFDRALQVRPNYVEALSNRGNALMDLLLPEQALASYELASQVEPDYADAWVNRGNALRDLKRTAEALDSYARALEIAPDRALAHWNEALCRLQVGDFAAGWEKYEWRWKTESLMLTARNFPQPLWLGKQSLRGKTILLHGEQGFGDTLQFCRYASQVAALGARVLLEVQPPLKALLENLQGVTQILGAGEPLPDFDFHCPLMSLPLAFQTTLVDISGASYLQVDEHTLQEWRLRLRDTGKKKVGLVWNGSTGHVNDRNRSLSLEDVKTLIDDRADFYCLQKELRPGDRDALARLPGIVFLGDALKDFSDTAALVALMDVVITVDTGVAHLAGALGKEVWILLPFNPDWRWLLDRDDSSWYSSARLFRQQRIGDWVGVLTRVKSELELHLPASLHVQPAATEQGLQAKLAAAVSMHQQGQLDQAEILYKEILQAKPQHFDALQLLGTISAQRSDAADAVALFEKALKINPDHASLLNNYGNALRGLLRLDEALKSFSHALQIDPGYAEAHANEGLCRLLMGDFARGWPKREWRWKTEQGLRLSRNFPQALWLGKEELKNKTILLHAEQGFGDTIQFCRYVRQVAARGARVVLEVQPPLKALLKNLEGVSQLVGRGEHLPAFDYQCPLMSLPLAFQAGLGSIAGEPYLKSDPEKLRKWRARLGETGKKRIGLVWSGNAAHANDKNRSLSLEDVTALLDDGARYYCLQKELRPADRDALTRLPGIEFLGDSLEDFSDTAAVVDLMDVVITVDTSVAHLAGALGKEVWMVLSFSPDWRWLLERSDNPWYASARLFRQQRIGDWASVLMQVKTELKARLLAPEGKAPATPSQSIAATLAAAVSLHQQGRLDQAGALYQKILQAQPNHFDALQLLGTVAAQQDRAADAAVLFERALKVNPADAGVLNNYGAALEDLKRPEEALASYDRALQIEPGYAEAWFNRGNALQSLGRLEEALDSFERAVQILPDHADALVGRGSVLRGLKRHEEALASYERALAISPGRFGALISCGNILRALKRPEEALASYERALQIRPGSVEAVSNKGNALRDLKRFPEALASYERALQLQPESIEAHNNLGNALWDLKRPEEALASYDRALRIYPDYAQALSNRGNALQDLKRLEEALASYDRALQIDPRHVEALSNRGNTLRELKRFEEALDSYERALQVDPDYPEALSNRGNALRDLNRPNEALASYARALQFAPDLPEIHWNEGLCRLLMGDFAMGWSKYEWRWKTSRGSREARNYRQPYWLGEDPLENKTLLLYGEQGFGDTIQFCRYARHAAARGAKVVLEVQPQLKTLLARLDGVTAVLGRGERLPDFDCYASLMSMPLAFQADLSNISGASYLQSDPQKLSELQVHLGASSKKRVGLVWSGSTEHKNDHNRSLSLEDIKVLVDDSADFYCLQKELRPADRDALTNLPGIRFLGDSLKDFSDTAALVALMDVVITVDTSVAHLAGALGKEVWLLLAFSPDWRWLLDRSDTPWYSSARLFRQPALGDWASMLMQVQAALKTRFQ